MNLPLRCIPARVLLGRAGFGVSHAAGGGECKAP